MNVMQQIPAEMIRRMKKRRFSVAADGVLLYADPILGRLENHTKRLVVALNVAKQRLELKHEGAVTAAFDLANGIEKACLSAFHAYFSAFEQLCQTARQPQPVAA